MTGSDQEEIEWAAIRAWPTEIEVRQGSWLLRSNGGYTKRANSAYALGSVDPGDIPTLRAWYAARELPLVIRESSLFPNPDLGKQLKREVFHRFDETLIMTGPTGGEIDARLESVDRAGWIEAYTRFEGATKGDQGKHASLIDAIPARVLTGLLVVEGTAAACGLAVADGQYLGLFDIATDQKQRRMGYGRALVRAMMAWGGEQGATVSYLQVLERNAAAIALYKDLGFSEAYRNWYWIQR